MNRKTVNSNLNGNSMEIGIIGFGRFGKLMARYLAEDCKVCVYNRSDKSKEIISVNAIPSTFEEACSKDIVIPSVPISEFAMTLKKIKSSIKKNALLIDVCSVKEYPATLMEKLLPKNVQILATHPMFGPDSAADSLNGRKLVLCKARIKEALYKKIKDYAKRKGLFIVETTPQNHDKEIAKSLVLTHFIGRGLIDFGATELDIDTQGYRKMMEVMNYVKNDTWQLFEDMNRYNKYSKKIRKDFLSALSAIDSNLEGK